MKLRNLALILLVLAPMALLAAGCGDDKKDDDKGKDSGKMSAAEKTDKAKRDALDNAKKSFEKTKNVDNCRSLAMSYIAVASPESPQDPKEAPKLPKDRDKNLKNAVNTLEDCTKIDGKNRDVKQMLASTYMATGKYDDAANLLKELAQSAKGQERANAYYAWGLAASNASDYTAAISAWTTFASLAPRKDPRIAQVRQSIKALQAAKNAPKPAAAKADTKEDTKKDEGDKDEDN